MDKSSIDYADQLSYAELFFHNKLFATSYEYKLFKLKKPKP